MRPGGDEERYEAKAERLEVNAAAAKARRGQEGERHQRPDRERTRKEV
jgi:hypothetical protein